MCKGRFHGQENKYRNRFCEVQNSNLESELIICVLPRLFEETSFHLVAVRVMKKFKSDSLM